MARENEGLRERKKRATRTAIATAARDLFAQHGFDHVKVADVAVAADVSEKTVFNHFATKEDLAFAGGEAGLAPLVTALRQRPPGTAVLDVFRTATDALLEAVATTTAEDDDLLVLARIVRESRTLRDRVALGTEAEAAALTAAIADGDDDDDLTPALVARTLAWTHRLVFQAALSGLLAGEDPKRLARRLRAAAAQAYDQLAGGLAGYGRREVQPVAASQPAATSSRRRSPAKRPTS
jgi:AcrR family transcriptional regulator